MNYYYIIKWSLNWNEIWYLLNNKDLNLKMKFVSSKMKIRMKVKIRNKNEIYDAKKNNN